MKLKVSTVILSHLSDVQETIQGMGNPDYSNVRINFVKYLVLTYEDTNVDIEPNKVFEEFKAKFPNLSH